MIRGPVLPLAREGLWRLVQQRPELFEHGLKLVVEGLDLGTEGLGRVDGLMRDAGGAPVLVFVTDNADCALPARIIAAYGFWARNAAGMARALPEATLRDGQRCRLLVIGAGLSPAVGDALHRLRLPELEVVEVDRFMVAGQERLVLRPLHGQFAGGGRQPIDEAVAEQDRAVFSAFDAFVQRLDPKIRVEGDRFSRRASFEGRSLGECWYAEERVLGLVAGQEPTPVESDDDLRVLVDQIARRYLAVLDAQAGNGPARTSVAPSGGTATAPDFDEDEALEASPVRGAGFETLRRSVGAARLSPAEFTALGTSGIPGDVGAHDYGYDQEQEGPTADG